LKRFVKVRVLLVIQIVATLLLQFQVMTVDNFFLNPFYIIGMVNGIFLMFMCLLYNCKSCHKHQIFGSGSLRIPRERCWNCEKDADGN
jgi:hypothetical protein